MSRLIEAFKSNSLFFFKNRIITDAVSEPYPTPTAHKAHSQSCLYDKYFFHQITFTRLKIKTPLKNIPVFSVFLGGGFA